MTEKRPIKNFDFRTARSIWHEETNTGPDPARWLGCRDAEDDERREG